MLHVLEEENVSLSIKQLVHETDFSKFFQETKIPVHTCMYYESADHASLLESKKKNNADMYLVLNIYLNLRDI